jgi:hypothetical protein
MTAISVLAIRRTDGPSSIRAFCDIQVGGVTIRGVKIIQQPDRAPWLGTPAVKAARGWSNTVELSKPLRARHHSGARSVGSTLRRAARASSRARRRLDAPPAAATERRPGSGRYRRPRPPVRRSHPVLMSDLPQAAVDWQHLLEFARQRGWSTDLTDHGYVCFEKNGSVVLGPNMGASIEALREVARRLVHAERYGEQHGSRWRT